MKTNAFRIEPLSSTVVGHMKVPGSKSITNRALICAALAHGPSRILKSADSDDTSLLVNGLDQLGVLVRRDGETLMVEGTGGRLFAPKFSIPVGNAGTTFRFLFALAGLAEGTTSFELSPRMAERPVDDLVKPLKVFGANIQKDPSGLIIRVAGGELAGGDVSVSGEKSSQFISALLLVGPYVSAPLLLTIDGELVSAPYVGMTLSVMRSFGVEVAQRTRRSFFVPLAKYHATEYAVEADASGATYPFAVAAILGGSMTVDGVHKDSVQGDAGFLDVLRKMGCEFSFQSGGVKVERNGPLVGVDVDMNGMPDAVPTLAALAMCAESPTRIRNVAHLRYKESNRLEVMVEELQKLGGHIVVVDDGLSIDPAPLRAARLSAHEDHRLAMSFAVLGLRVPGLVVEQPRCVAKSYPGFWDELSSVASLQDA